MSAELILGLLVGVAGIGATIAVAVWQLLHGEPRKKSLPPKIDVTYFALTALVTAQKNSPTANAGLTYDQLYIQIVEDCNSYTAGGNFDPTGKNRLLHSYTQDSINRLRYPESQTLGPLIEELDDAYRVTTLGLDIHNRLPDDPSEQPRKLADYLRGSNDIRSSRSAEATEQVPNARTLRRPQTPKEWRYAVLMAMPEDDAYELNDLKQLIGQELSLSSLKGSTHEKVEQATNLKKVEQAIEWNLQKKHLLLEVDCSIRLAVPKTSKTLDDFR